MDIYRKHCITLGKEIVVEQNGTKSPATALNIHDDGGLVVRFADGSEKTVSFGEVSIRGICGYV